MTDKEREERWDQIRNTITTLLPFVLSAILALQVYMVGSIHEVQRWMTGIEANRFTMHDWVRERKSLIEELPPRWVQDELKDLQLADEDIKSQMTRIQLELDRRAPQVYDGDIPPRRTKE